MHKLFTDGGSRGNPGPAASAAFLFNDDQLVGFDAAYLGSTTNNVAEYNGLLIGLAMAAKQGVQELLICMDSELIIKQLKGEYRIKDANMVSLASKVKILLENFSKIELKHVPREQNKFADRMVNIVLDSKLS